MRAPLLQFLAPHAVALTVEIAIAIHAARHRSVRGASELSLFTFSQAAWTLGYIFETLSASQEAKIAWDNFQFLGTAGWLLGTFAFAVRYSDRVLPYARLVWGTLLSIALVYLGLVFTDRFHHLIRPEAHLQVVAGIAVLVYPFTTITWAAYLYFLGVFFVGIGFLVKHALGVRRSYWSQNALVIAGTSIPMVGTTLTLLGYVPDLYRDSTPFTFALGDLLIAWGLLRHRLLDVIPVARDVVFENLRDRVVVVDRQNRIVDLNPEAARVLGRAQKDVIGRPAPEVFAAWSDVASRFANVEETQTEVVAGTEHLALRISPLRDQRGELVGRVIVAHDITALKDTQRALESRNAELSSVNVELDAYSYTVSHDLRAPLRAIAAFSKRLSAATELAPDARELVERIEANAMRMQELTNDLLDFARLGRLPLQKEPVSVTDVVREVVGALHGRAEAASVEVVIRELPPCQADRSLLRQVFENLIGNAVKFAAHAPNPRVEAGFDVQVEGTVYFVRDNGIGFDQAYADQLFVAFRRLHDDSEVEGTGVGLATVKQIVTRHGGRVWAESAPGKGATFFFTLGPYTEDRMR